MGRIYTNVVTIGNINVYQVSSDPNGVLFAPIGSLAVRSDLSGLFQNQDGLGSWSQISGSLPPVELKSLAQDPSATEARVLPGLISVPFSKTRTAVFTAPVDLTLKNFLFYTSGYLLDPGEETKTVNSGGPVFILQINVAGTGPDVGSLMDGAVLTCLPFIPDNAGVSPEWGVRMNAGDTISIVLSSLGGEDSFYNAEFTYEEGLSDTLPKRFIGGVFTQTGALNFQSSGTISVNAAPLSVGDGVSLSTNFAGLKISSQSSSGGGLTGVAGPRTPGQNDFDASLPTVTEIRNDMLASLQDFSNSWSSAGGGLLSSNDWDFSAVGADQILVETNLFQSGAIRNLDIFEANSSNPGDLTVTGTGFLQGGTSGAETLPSGSPTVDCVLESVYFAGFPFAVSPPLVFNATYTVGNVLVNSDPNIAGVGPKNLPNIMNKCGFIETLPVSMAPGDTLDLLVTSTFAQACFAFAVAQTV